MLAGQPAAALIGQVVEVKVTETHKWHVTGHIVNASPKIPHVDSATYFAEKQKEREKKN